jgi:hypothetical protein
VPDAVVADGAVAKERTTRTDLPVVVKRDDGGNPLVAARIQHRRADEGEGVLDVHDVRLGAAQHRREITARLLAPHDP